MEKLLVIDGTCVARTVYEANPSEDSLDKVEGAFRSALSTMRRLVVTYKPTHLLAAFDSPGDTWRHLEYASYKASRKPAPEILSANWHLFLQGLTTMGLQGLAVEGLEAEDIMATVAARWHAAQKGPIVAVSKDKDTVALTKLFGADVYHPFPSEDSGLMGNDWSLKKFGVPVEMVPDMLALMGDTSDDIPGVPSIGLKTAAKLLLQYGNVDEILFCADEVPGKAGKALLEHAGLAILSKRLVSLKTDADFELSWDTLKL